MMFLLHEIAFEWDDEDPLRFRMVMGDTALNMDATLARQLATAMTEMAERVDRKVNDAIAKLES